MKSINTSKIPMPKANKQAIIDSIIAEIEKGTDRGKVVAKYCKKFQKSARTIDTYWKVANEQHLVKQQAIKEKLTAIDTAAAIEARKKAIMSADERKELLTKLITGEIKAKRPFVIGGKIMEYPEEPTHRDRISAIAELNKMDGSYTPIKVANTDKNGEDVQPLSDTQVDKILSVIEKLS